MNERKTPRPATPPGASAAPSRLEAKQWADNVAVFSFLVLSASLLISIAFAAAMLADSDSVDAFYVVVSFNGSVGIVLAIIAASSRHRMSEPRRRLATASMVMAGAQIAAVPILVILGLAMFYANF
ncbi:hypothetical protein [Candidatus Poriferisodalis sp.]|uniref:hypothetical protein n=1 Tax=Candidatus Poriferisodalis sp. TaxID=3101277 RepID=UPI003C6EE353